VLEVLYHHAKFGGARVSPATGVANIVEFFMAALWYRAGHYIFALWFLSSSSIFLLLFPPLISAAAEWTSTILRHMMWP